MPRAGDSVISQRTPTRDEWLRPTAIGHQIVSNKLENIWLRSRPLVCPMTNVLMVAARMTRNILDVDTPSHSFLISLVHRASLYRSARTSVGGARMDSALVDHVARRGCKMSCYCHRRHQRVS